MTSTGLLHEGIEAVSAETFAMTTSKGRTLSASGKWMPKSRENAWHASSALARRAASFGGNPASANRFPESAERTAGEGASWRAARRPKVLSAVSGSEAGGLTGGRRLL